MYRALYILVLLLLAVLPLVWLRDYGFVALYHVAGILVLLVALGQRNTRVALSTAVKSGSHIWLGCVLLTAAATLSLAKENPPMNSLDVIRHLAYSLIAFGAAVATISLVRSGKFYKLYVAPLITVVILIWAMRYSLQEMGTDLLPVLRRAIAASDPNLIIFPLFKGAFLSSLTEVVVSLRHGLAQGVLCTALVGLAAHPFHPRPTAITRMIAWGGAGAALAIVVFTFSRSTWLAAGLAVIVFSLQAFGSGRRLFIAFCTASIGFLALSVTPVPQMVAARLQSNESYSARVDAGADRWAEIGQHPLFGSESFGGDEAHNLFIDYWASTGLLGALGAALLIFAVAEAMLRCTMEAGTNPNRAARPVLALTCGMLALPMARYFTSPNGLPQVGSWVALGIAIGLMATCIKNAEKARTRQRWAFS